MLEDEPSQRAINIAKRRDIDDYIGEPTSKGAPPDIFDDLAKQFPEYCRPNRFSPAWIEAKLPFGHPDLERLLTSAVNLGLTPQRNRADVPAQIIIRDYVGFSAEEIQSAVFVECERFRPFIAGSSMLNEERLDMLASDQYIKRGKNRCFGSLVNLFHLFAVRGKAKEALESAGLKGLLLLPLVPDSGKWPHGIEPLHLIWSSHQLPPVDGKLLVDGSYEIFQSKERDTQTQSRQCHLLDGYDISPQLRYRNLGVLDFDVAITREVYGGRTPHYHKIVYSQKARTVLESIDRKLRYKPVILTGS